MKGGPGRCHLLAVASLAIACGSVPCPASGKPAPANDARFEARVELTDGPGPTLASYHLRERVLTKVVRRSDDGGPVGVSRATLTEADPLPGALAKLAEGTVGPAPAADTPAATIWIRRGAGERRVALSRPPASDQAARTLAALDAARVAPVVTLELAVLPFAGVRETNGTRPVTVRMTVKGITGARVRVRAGDVAIELTDLHPAVPGVTPLPPEWIAVSEPAAGPAVLTVKPGMPVDVPLRTPIPAAGPFALRAVLAGTVTFNAPGIVEESAVTASSAPVIAPVEPSGHQSGRSHRE